jgi:tRNA nucleotidyltransferase (CCA-adding enzyme)
MINHRKIENHFTEHIINLVGPTEESDKQKEEKFNNIKDLITKILIEEKIDLIPHIYCFGSYPIKTYLQDSDLDVTIIFKDKEKKSFVTNYSYEFLNK